MRWQRPLWSVHEGSQADRLMLMNSLSSSQDGGNEVATTFVVVESKDTEILTKADRRLPLCWLWWVILRSFMTNENATLP